MKKLLFASLLSILFLVGCDQTNSLINVRRAFPNAEVSPITQRQDIFLIRKIDGSVWAIQANYAGMFNDDDAKNLVAPYATQILPPNK